jgi:putative FmdB family regulatory protein
MPTYGYECLSCDNQFEISQSIKADALTTCTECGGSLRKRIYPVGISFKGSGFYVNDYAAKPAGGSGASGSGEASAETVKSDTKAEATGGETQSEPKSETKNESKPEPKPENKAESKPEASKSEASKSEAKAPAAT